MFNKICFSVFSWMDFFSPTSPPFPGCLWISVEVPEIHLKPIHRQCDGSRYAVQWGPVSGKGPLHPEKLWRHPLPAPEPCQLHHQTDWWKVRGEWSSFPHRCGCLGRKLHLSVLRGSEVFIQTFLSTWRASLQGLINWLFSGERPLLIHCNM